MPHRHFGRRFRSSKRRRTADEVHDAERFTGARATATRTSNSTRRAGSSSRVANWATRARTRATSTSSRCSAQQPLDVGPVTITPGDRLVDDQVLDLGDREDRPSEVHRRRPGQGLSFEWQPRERDVERRPDSSCRSSMTCCSSANWRAFGIRGDKPWRANTSSAPSTSSRSPQTAASTSSVVRGTPRAMTAMPPMSIAGAPSESRDAASAASVAVMAESAVMCDTVGGAESVPRVRSLRVFAPSHGVRRDGPTDQPAQEGEGTGPGATTSAGPARAGTPRTRVPPLTPARHPAA